MYYGSAVPGIFLFCQWLQCCITADRMGGNSKPDVNLFQSQIFRLHGWDPLRCLYMLLIRSHFFTFIAQQHGLD